MHACDDALFATHSNIKDEPPINFHLFIVLLTLELEPIRLLLDPRNLSSIESCGIRVLGKDLLADREGWEGIAGQWYRDEVRCGGFVAGFVAVLVFIYILDIVCHSREELLVWLVGRREEK